MESYKAVADAESRMQDAVVGFLRVRIENYMLRGADRNSATRVAIDDLRGILAGLEESAGTHARQAQNLLGFYS